MNQACFSENVTGLASSTQLTLHEQKLHASCIRPLKNNFVRMKTHTLTTTIRIKVLYLVVFVMISGVLSAQKNVTGRVVDEGSSQPLLGVCVSVVGHSTSVFTDNQGKFTIALPTREAQLQLVLLGYATKLVKVKAGETVLVTMAQKVVELDELLLKTEAGKAKPQKRGAVIMLNQKDIYGSVGAMSPSAISAAFPESESYAKVRENGFKMVKKEALSTFSIDVDRASYSNMCRFINQGVVPPQDAIRVEELINYFEYDYPQPTGNDPFTINTELATCPWQGDHQLLRIGIQGKKIPVENLPPSNLVFLLDVSGSMESPNKLPLVKQAFRLLVNNLRDKDHVAIVVYAGAAGLVLPSTKGSDKARILAALDGLTAGGSTAGCEGISLAYKTAAENFIKEGNNRVILATDGDFNVGISNENELEDFITKKRKSGIYLTCLGFGMGNYKDSKMEVLADKGNGNYAYINNILEANKVFVNEFGGTLFTIAKDVKAQIEFNPALVQSYRLVGYENRLLNDEDFKDDTKDAGDLGSGHTVTALYEIVPVGAPLGVDPLKYQPTTPDVTANIFEKEVATIKFRYKKPDDEKSIEMVHPISKECKDIAKASENTRFASSVAMFGMILSNSKYKGTSSYESLIKLAENARGTDKDGYRIEFIRMAKASENLKLSASLE
jgi:Ca-activated chloride channel homolog